MLKRTFDPHQPHRFVDYTRMSDKKQNKLSPKQQSDVIERVIKRMGLPWKKVGSYRDLAQKGGYIQKRKAFNKMLTDIRSGRLKVDVIAVDTTERFARSEEIEGIRKELYKKYRVVVVTAESNFASPLTPQGKIYAAVEGFRSTEENRIKAHQIVRAKWDLASRKFWPGGPAPDGLKLKKVIEETDGVETVIGSRVVPDADFKKWIRMAFVYTKEAGKGPAKVARYIKQYPDFPKGKNISGSTVKYWLKNKLYKGVLEWGANCTGIEDDVRKVEPNHPDDILVVQDFCEPIVEPELWDAVEVIRNSRKRNFGKNEDGEKQLKHTAVGFTISHMLSGLVRCGCCGCSMTPNTSGRKSKSGKSYTYYNCPRKHDGGCKNCTGIPETWLKDRVIGYLGQNLLGDVAAQSGAVAELKRLVQEYLNVKKDSADDPRPNLKSEIKDISKKMLGWVQSLSNPGLPIEARHAIETEMASESQRKSALEQALLNCERFDVADSYIVEDSDVLSRLSRLGQVVGDANPCLAHLELSLHIDRIDCYPDGLVKVRYCRLGAGGMDLIAMIEALEVRESDSVKWVVKCKPRRRARIQATSESHESSELDALSLWASDPYRFEELGEQWFEVVEFAVPEPTCWAKENAIAVSEMRLLGRTHEELSEHFDVSVPTIRKALKIGKTLDPKFRSAPRKMARARWHEVNAELVFTASKSMKMKDMVKHFSKSDVTLRKAIVHAREVLGQE